MNHWTEPVRQQVSDSVCLSSSPLVNGPFNKPTELFSLWIRGMGDMFFLYVYGSCYIVFSISSIFLTKLWFANAVRLWVIFSLETGCYFQVKCFAPKYDSFDFLLYLVNAGVFLIRISVLLWSFRPTAPRILPTLMCYCPRGGRKSTYLISVIDC